MMIHSAANPHARVSPNADLPMWKITIVTCIFLAVATMAAAVYKTTDDRADLCEGCDPDALHKYLCSWDSERGPVCKLSQRCVFDRSHREVCTSLSLD